jgi:hypothetical protein
MIRTIVQWGGVGRRLSLLLGLVLLAGAAEAQDSTNRWVRVDRTPDVAVYVDSYRARVVDSSAAIVEIWASFEHTSVQAIRDKKFNRWVGRWQLDCVRDKSRSFGAAFYLDKQFIFSIEVPGGFAEWQSATPGTINETLTIRGCLIAAGQPTEPVK